MDSIDATIVPTIQWDIHLLITSFFSMILVNRFSNIFTQGIIQQYLLMDRLELENPIPFKGMRKREFCRCVLRIYTKKEKCKIALKGWQHLSELHIFKFITKSFEILWTLAIDKSRYNKLEQQFLFKVLLLFFVNPMSK